MSFAERIQVDHHASEIQPMDDSLTTPSVDAQQQSDSQSHQHHTSFHINRSRPQSRAADNLDHLHLPSTDAAHAHSHDYATSTTQQHHQRTSSEFVSTLHTPSPQPSFFSQASSHTEPRCIILRRCVFGFPAKDPDPDGEDEDDEATTTTAVTEAKPLLPSETTSTDPLSPTSRRASRSESIISLFQLRIDKFVAKENQLIAVVGKIGSGKTTLLQAILGELNLLNPPPTAATTTIKSTAGLTITAANVSKYRNSFSIATSGSLPLAYMKKPAVFSVQGTISYIPQQAFLETATLRENILFGETMKLEWYDQVIEGMYECFHIESRLTSCIMLKH